MRSPKRNPRYSKTNIFEGDALQRVRFVNWM